MRRNLNPDDIREVYGIESKTVIDFLSKIPFGKGVEYYQTLKELIRKDIVNDDLYYKACKCLDDISNNGDGRWKDD